jgi:hypothetical protein
MPYDPTAPAAWNAFDHAVYEYRQGNCNRIQRMLFHLKKHHTSPVEVFDWCEQHKVQRFEPSDD